MEESFEDKIITGERGYQLRRHLSQFIVNPLAQLLQIRKIFTLPLGFNKLPQSFNRIELRAMSGLKDWDEKFLPAQCQSLVGRCLIHLNQSHIITQFHELPRRVGGRGFSQFRHATRFLSLHLPKLLHRSGILAFTSL